jgi:hypothetical protein
MRFLKITPPARICNPCFFPSNYPTLYISFSSVSARLYRVVLLFTFPIFLFLCSFIICRLLSVEPCDTIARKRGIRGNESFNILL